ncbi:MAG TPA: pyridoxamine 5'-phosphate oxidase family protein [Gaiellaceae bacterium]
MKLDGREIEELLAVDVPAHLATIDPRGFPRVTPIWFVWADGAFYMTSVEGQPHLRNIARNPRTSVCVDTEEPESAGGIRPHRQVKGYGEAELFPDEAGEWTRRITLKYIRGEAADATAARRAAMPRVVIRLRPLRMTARGT